MVHITMFVLLAVALSSLYQLILFVYGKLSRSRKLKKFGCEEPPRYPHKDPIFGWDLWLQNLKAFKSKSFQKTTKELFDRYGPTFSCIAMGREAFMTIEVSNVQAVFGLNFDDFGVQAFRLEPSEPFVGKGVFNTDGPYWRHSRDLLRPSFTRQNVANLPGFEVHLQKMLKLVPIDGSTVVDLKPLLFSLFMDTSTEFLFGQSTCTLDPRTPLKAAEFLDAFQYCLIGMGRRLQLGKLKFLYRDNKWYRSIQVAHAFADNYVDKALEYRRSYLLQDKSELLKQHQEISRAKHVLLYEMAKESGDRDELRAQIIQTFMAAHDTAAITVTNVMFQLCRNKDKWHKLRKEILSVGERELTFETLKDLRYLQFVIKETLRLHPVSSANTRVAMRDTILPTGGGKEGKSPVLVTAGQAVLTSMYALHHSREFWGDDVESWVPERWETVRPGWHYQPFGGGPRVCPGQNLALTEVAYVVARFAQEWKDIINKDETLEWVERMTVTASSANGCKIAIVAAS